MGLDYILIFVIVISVILYKLKSFQPENLNIEKFNNYINYNYLKDDM